METKRLQQVIDFLLTIERYKTIERTHVTSNFNRHESDAEHSWHLAMFVWLLSPAIDPTIDQLRLMKMLLMHDLVEIYAGDVYAFDKEAQIGKQEREHEAALKLFAQLPDDLAIEFHDLFDEFEGRSTPAAQLAQAFDKLQPILQNVATDGRAWQKGHLTYREVDDHKRPYMEYDQTVLAAYELLMDRADGEKMFEQSSPGEKADV